MTYTVGQMAKKIGISSSALRYYDKEGLLPFVERSAGGIRLFNDSDAEMLRIIECLKKTGMSIKEIKCFVDFCVEGDETISQRLALIQKQKVAVLAQIEQLNETMKVLDYKSWYYETAKKAGTTKVHDTLRQEDIPPQHRVFVQVKKEVL